MLRKHIITTFLFLLCALAGAQAQQLTVSSFKCLPTDLDARVNHSVTDHNGKKCAIIKVENSNTGFAFDTGTLAVQKVEQKTGEIWVYVQPGVRKMTISHQTLGILREYAFPEQIKEATVYVMKLESGNVHTIVEQAPTGAYLTMRLTPTNATVWIDDELQSVVDGEVLTFLTNGSHIYRVQAAGFAQEIGKVEINGQRKDMQVALQSTKATLTLFCADTQATLFIDGKQVGTGQWSGELIPGTHILEAKRDNHRAQTKQIELKERETLEHRFEAPVAINGTLQIASRPIDSEVWIDGKKIGTTPYGPEKMIVGTHSLELRKEGYRSLKKEIVISEGETCLVNNNLEKEVAAVAAAVDGDNNIQTFTVNGVSFSMVKVAGGTFTMGSTKEQGSDANDNEKPTHKVTLDTYHIGQTEVTQALWQAVMGKNPSVYKGDNLPVEYVSWNDCQEFIKKLNALTGKKFRLPTEAEWEYAARGGNRSRGYKYSGSNSIDEVAWYGENSGSETHAVATKKANELGIYDMSGNVFEWCSDWFEGGYSSSHQTNPVGPSSGSRRVARGCGWAGDSWLCRVSYRCGNSPDFSFPDLGLRLVLDEKGVNVATNVLNDNATPANSGKNMDFTVNGVKFSMIEVAGGTFTMGGTSEQGSDAYHYEKPTHEVTLDTYHIGQTEVTQALWEAVMGKNPSWFKGDDLPVEKVSRNDCREFIKKLNALTGKKFRLPTEAEWEYAARGGNRSRGYKYSGSNNINEVAWFDDNSGNNPHAVATKKANELGIYDMSGNVEEWCNDRYGNYSSSSQVNPVGSSFGSRRVYRGGGWSSISWSCRVSYRDDYSPGTSYSFLGLRLVLEP